MKLQNQTSFFDDIDLLERLTCLGDPLITLAKTIDFESFRPTLMRIRDQPKKSNAGAKPFDVVLMFKMLVLQKLNNLSDFQLELLCTDRLSYRRFLGLRLADKVPDQNTVWAFREELNRHDLVTPLFEQFMDQMKGCGLEVKSGQIVDASFIDAPRQRNTRAENESIKADEFPKEWEDKSNGFLRQKDLEARWAKKGDETHYGYKDHVNVDAATKIITEYMVTSAEVHDSQALMEVVETKEQGWSDRELYADSAYRSAEIEESLKASGVVSMVHEKAYRNAPLNEGQKGLNKRKSRVRARVEHVFGAMKQMKNDTLRTIGLARAKVQIGLSNLVYNMKRFVWLSGNGELSRTVNNPRKVAPNFA